MIHVASGFLPAFLPREVKETLPQEKLSFLRNSANLFNFGAKEVYQIKEHEGQLVALSIGKQKASFTSILVKVALIATIIFPFLAYLAATLYHRCNRIQIAHALSEQQPVALNSLKVQREIDPRLSSVETHVLALAPVADETHVLALASVADETHVPASASVADETHVLALASVADETHVLALASVDEQQEITLVSLLTVAPGNQPDIKHLFIDTLVDIENRIKDFPNLRWIKVESNLLATDVSFIKNCSALTSLDLSGCTKIQDLSFLEHCSALTSLDLGWCKQIKDFSSLKYCPTLASLNLSFCNIIQDISFLEGFTELTKLDLSHNPGFQNFSFLKACTGLKWLNLSFCSTIEDLSFLDGCSELICLSLEDCSKAKNFSFLSKCLKMTELDLSGVNVDSELLESLRGQYPTIAIYS